MANYLADGIVALHVAYVAFVVLGQLLITVGGIVGWRWVRNVWFRAIHFTMMAIVVYEQWADIRCPLSVWEEQLRVSAGQTVSEATFMGRILHHILFYDAPERVFTAGYTSFGALILLTLVCVPPRFCQRRLRTTA